MSFTWFAAMPLHTRADIGRALLDVADELDMPDKKGAFICEAMCMFQEAGAPWAGKRHVWTPGNNADPCFKADPDRYPHDSMGNDNRSVGPNQQQTSGPPPATQWGWGGLIGDPEGTRKRMDLHESVRLFMASLKKKGYDASNAHSAGVAVQRVQGSSFPDAYEKWWDEAHALYAEATNQPVQETPVAWTGDPVWLEDVLRPALGDRLKTFPGWKDRGHGDFGSIWGVVWHHTGNSNEKPDTIANHPTLGLASNLHIAPNGTVTITGVGVAWHAGQGSYPGLPTNNANQHTIGIECAWPDIRPDGSYDPGQKWPDAQIIAMRDVGAALTAKLGVDVSHNIGHKEWAGAAQGKWDPGNLDMNWFRGEIAKDMRGEFDAPVVQPPPPPPVLPPVLPAPTNPRTDRQLLEEIFEQLRGPGARGWPQLGGRTLVDAVAELLKDKA